MCPSRATAAPAPPATQPSADRGRPKEREKERERTRERESRSCKLVEEGPLLLLMRTCSLVCEYEIEVDTIHINPATVPCKYIRVCVCVCITHIRVHIDIAMDHLSSLMSCVHNVSIYRDSVHF